MPENPITVQLPKDLPTNWLYGQTVAPTGQEVGLSVQHGYNYLMQQVNNVQQAASELGAAHAALTGEDIPTSADDETDLATALSNKAPGGFGLGGNVASAPLNEEGNADANLITQSGFFRAIANVPEISGWNYILHINYSSTISDAIQLGCIVALTTSNWATRRKIDSVWGPWEWMSPPLQIGVEYRTTERYGGNPVYVQSINFGTLPDASSKSVNHNIQNYGGVVSYTGRASYYNLIGHPGVDSISIAGSTITIVTNANLSTQSAIITLKYIKTTD